MRTQIHLLDGQAYEISFGYTTLTLQKQANGKMKVSGSLNGVSHLDNRCPIITRCRISRVNPAKRGAEKFEEVAMGSVTRRTDQPFDKGVGRRLSLAAALRNLTSHLMDTFAKSGVGYAAATQHCREVRKAFWAAYFRDTDRDIVKDATYAHLFGWKRGVAMPPAATL